MKMAAIVLALFILVLPVYAAAATDPTVPSSDPEESTGEIAFFAVSSGDLNDLTYYDIDSSLGEIRIYLPEGYNSNTLQIFDGHLINTTNSTIYPYCPDYPEYTFQASRWSSLCYRPNASGYSYTDLENVVILDTVDQTAGFSQIYIFLLLSILFALLVRRSFPS